MPSVKDTPTFNVKVVVRATNLKPDTLRAWERRYGLPVPKRTAGGHRLYSQHDIDTLNWLIARQAEGLTISRAVALYREYETNGRDPFLEHHFTGEVSQATDTIKVGEALVQLRTSWVEYCLGFREQDAKQVLAQAFSLYTPETVCNKVLQKGLAEVGRLLYEAEVSVQQEHFASALANLKLDALIAALPVPTRPGRLLIGCPLEEEHTFSPRLLSFLLRRRGWEVVFLGANVPLDRMDGTLQRNQPRLVILSAQTLPAAATLLEMGDLLFDAGVPLGYGGLIFNRLPALLDHIPGHYLGKRLQDAPALIERLMSAPSTAYAKKVAVKGYRESQCEYREHQALIESRVWKDLNGAADGLSSLRSVNISMSQYIIAALTLGDLELLGYAFEWLRGLLSRRDGASEAILLNRYLAAYGQAAREVLGADSSNVILAWLEKAARA